MSNVMLIKLMTAVVLLAFLPFSQSQGYDVLLTTNSAYFLNTTPFRDLTLTCSVTPHHPGLMYTFFRDNTILRSTSSDVMELLSVGFKDSGVYWCKVIVPGNVEVGGPPLTLFIAEIPTLSTNGPPVTPYGEVTLTCSVKSPVSNMIYIFLKDNRVFASGPDPTLTLSESKDTGVYTCRVKLENGKLSIPSSAKKLVISDCASTPCKNGAACSNNVTGFLCSCAPGYTGKTCSTNVDDCSSNPCQEGTICVDMINDFSCLCVPPKDIDKSCKDTGNTLCTDFVLTTVLLGLALFYN